MVNTKRRKGESFESLYRRFSRRVQQSGNILQTRKIRFHIDPPNDTEVKKSAIRRLVTGAKRKYLIRIGQMEDTRRGRGRRHR